jgi:hypothetical protein
VTPDELLASASDLMHRPDLHTAGVWPRTCAFLTRQALEQAIRDWWTKAGETRTLADRSMRSQLTCLPHYLDPATAGEAAHTWAALSHACHYQPYELAPTAAELTGWISDVTAVVSKLSDGKPDKHTAKKGHQ